jgi:3-hydroxyacyl-[acyl-carrier-protein] dehydratase
VTTLDIAQISALLKREYPLLLIDGVTLLKPGVMCNAFKNLTYNEWFFPSHFPDHPIMPGSLQLEAFTQAVALPLLINSNSESDNEIPILLAGIDKVRYYHSVFPGDRLDIFVHIERVAMGIASANVKAEVREEIVTECKITYKLMGGV